MQKAKGVTRRQVMKWALASGSFLSTSWSGRVFATAAKPEVIIAVCTPLSGVLAYNGKATVQGAQLALEQVNAKGGMGGRMFKLVIGDDAANPKEAIPFLRKALMSEKACAVTGIVASDVALAAKGFLEERKVANLPIMGSVNELVTEGTRYTFRLIGSVYQWQIAIPQFMKFMGVKRVAMVHEDSSYGRDSAKDFVPEARKQGLDVVAVKMTPFTETNFIPIFNEVKGLEPEGIYFVYAGAINLFAARQMYEAGMRPKVRLGVYTTSLPYFPDGLKDIVIGYCSWGRPTKAKRIQEIAQIYETKYNQTLDMFACMGYDAINVITEAAIRAKSDDPEAVRNEIAKTSYDGICGYRIEFTKNGGTLKYQMYINQWEKVGSGYRLNEIWHSDVIPPSV
jgi:branched-chain amino acid transport system substrate-binding protein